MEILLSKQQTGPLFLFVEMCESPTYTVLISLTLESTLWIQGRSTGYIQSLGDVLCSLWPTQRAWPMKSQVMQFLRDCLIRGLVRGQVSNFE